MNADKLFHRSITVIRLERSVSIDEKGKSRTPPKSCTGFEFVSWGWNAKLSHEILYVIVNDKAHNLALIVEYLLDLVLDINTIAVPWETPLQGLQCARKFTPPVYAGGDLITAYLVFDDCAFEVRNGVEKSFGILDKTVRSVQFLPSWDVYDDSVDIHKVFGLLPKAAVIERVNTGLSKSLDVHFSLLSK